jgi:hypothetical protein
VTTERQNPTPGAPAPPTESARETPPPERLREDIEHTREQLGDTVEALAAKTDVKAQAHQRVTQAKHAVRHRREQLTAKAQATTPDSAKASGAQIIAKVRDNPAPTALTAAALTGFALGRLTAR